jgi:hypothetical protein
MLLLHAELRVRGPRRLIAKSFGGPDVVPRALDRRRHLDESRRRPALVRRHRNLRRSAHVIDRMDARRLRVGLPGVVDAGWQTTEHQHMPPPKALTADEIPVIRGDARRRADRAPPAGGGSVRARGGDVSAAAVELRRALTRAALRTAGGER